MEVHERVRSLIDERGVSQEWLAIQLNKSHDWVNARCIGRTKIKVDELPEIANALRVDPCWLLLGDHISHSMLPSYEDRVTESSAAYLNRRRISDQLADRLARIPEDARRPLLDLLDVLERGVG